MSVWDQQNIQRIGFIRSIGIFIFWKILPRLLVPSKRWNDFACLLVTQKYQDTIKITTHFNWDMKYTFLQMRKSQQL